MNAPELTVQPIGYLKSRRIVKFDAPHQPDPTEDLRDEIHLVGHKNFETALTDLEGFSHIWLIWWFDRNTTWKPMVRPPRGSDTKRGMFATRSPHRPNPIGISVVPLLKVNGRVLTIGSHDLIDGTPILDIKPYIPKVDSIPHAVAGWVDAMESQLAEPAPYEVTIRPLAEAQLAWLADRHIELPERVQHILARDPTPHRTRRIKKLNDGTLCLSCGAWRVHYAITDRSVAIVRMSPGYPEKSLRTTGTKAIPYRSEQLEFLARWPEL